MKKTVRLIIALALCAFAVTAFATATAEENVSVYVTVSDGDGIVLALDKLAVADSDKDGAITISDAIYSAHEAKYPGGASAGYATAESQYGLGITKLWGVENGGSYGYYVNNKAASSLNDPVVEGDFVYAYAFGDTVGFSDVYSYFDVNAVSAEEGQTFTLTLSAAGYDESWNPIVTPVEGAVITVNGEETDFKTDASGKAAVRIDGHGTFTLSAVSSSMVLVPPVCVATVESAGISPVWYAVIAAAAVALAAVIAWASKKAKKRNEK